MWGQCPRNLPGMQPDKGDPRPDLLTWQAGSSAPSGQLQRPGARGPPCVQAAVTCTQAGGSQAEVPQTRPVQLVWTSGPPAPPTPRGRPTEQGRLQEPRLLYKQREDPRCQAVTQVVSTPQKPTARCPGVRAGGRHEHQGDCGGLGDPIPKGGNSGWLQEGLGPAVPRRSLRMGCPQSREKSFVGTQLRSEVGRCHGTG